MIIEKLELYSFLLNLSKYHYFTSTDHQVLVINGQEIPAKQSLKCLGKHLCATGIAYEQDLAGKTHKAIHAATIIAWTKYYAMFRTGYKSFMKSCLLPIFGYGCELYDDFHLVQLELLSKKVMKVLHSC